jgi:hypothetical protein
MRRPWLVGAALVAAILLPAAGAAAAPPKHRPVPQAHPRLLGSLDELKVLARQRAGDYQRVAQVARAGDADDYSKVVSAGLVAAIEGDARLARQAKDVAMKYVGGPIKKGHVPFGHDLALCAFAYDLAHPQWSPAERAQFFDYMNRTVDANVESETHVFHNAWYGYKNWGIGLACYATYHENPRAPAILDALEDDYRKRAAPALELAGEGGGFAEGYYVHYWLYEWLVFCEAARRCDGTDYYALAPKFFRHRAIASAFEMYPGIGQYGSRRPAPMGDGGGRLFGGDRDKALAARRILVNYYRNDPEHQAVHAFNETTPRSSVGNYAHMDFLWRDPTVPKGDLAAWRRSHLSRGPGYVYARSSWDDDATWFFFKCGNRFTAHQHLDVGHFLLYKHAELVGDGGHYDEFGTRHDVNYHLRTIAHNALLVHDPAETWKNIRGRPAANDGGQSHAWRHHNGAFVDPDDWRKQYESAHIADLLAFEDRQSYLYVAGDCTRAYSPRKLEFWTRQIIFLRPGTVVIFDRVKTKDPAFQKTWLLQAMKPPVNQAPHLVVTNGKGRLFVQTLLPAKPQVRLCSGDDLYRYGGQSFPPSRNTGPAPECRIEVSPSSPAAVDYFLHVLTATDASVESVPPAAAAAQGSEVLVALGDVRIAFSTQRVGGRIERGGKQASLSETVRAGTE